MLSTDYDRKVEQLMNDEGLSHKEAMEKLGAKKKSKDNESDADEGGSDSDLQSISLPEGLLPNVPKGKEIDVSICGKVVGSSDGMVQIEPKRFSVNISEPMKPAEMSKGPSY